MSTTFRPRSKRRLVAIPYSAIRRQPTVLTTSETERCRIYVGEGSFLAPYRAQDFATLLAQQDPASVIGIPSLRSHSVPANFIRVGHVSRVEPA